jgi:hypothetical protein
MNKTLKFIFTVFVFMGLIICGTIILLLIGAFLFLPTFFSDEGFLTAIWMTFWTSVLLAIVWVYMEKEE